MPFFVDSQPLLGVTFIFRDQVAHLVVEDLSPSTGDRLQSCVHHHLHAGSIIYLGFLENVMILNRGKRFYMKFRAMRLDLAEQLAVKGNIVLRQYATYNM